MGFLSNKNVNFSNNIIININCTKLDPLYTLSYDSKNYLQAPLYNPQQGFLGLRRVLSSNVSETCFNSCK